MKEIIGIIAILLALDMIWCPRIDKTRMGDVLLYYGSPGNRKYLKLWKIQNYD